MLFNCYQTYSVSLVVASLCLGGCIHPQNSDATAAKQRPGVNSFVPENPILLQGIKVDDVPNRRNAIIVTYNDNQGVKQRKLLSCLHRDREGRPNQTTSVRIRLRTGPVAPDEFNLLYPEPVWRNTDALSDYYDRILPKSTSSDNDSRETAQTKKDTRPRKIEEIPTGLQNLTGVHIDYPVLLPLPQDHTRRNPSEDLEGSSKKAVPVTLPGVRLGQVVALPLRMLETISHATVIGVNSDTGTAIVQYLTTQLPNPHADLSEQFLRFQRGDSCAPVYDAEHFSRYSNDKNMAVPRPLAVIAFFVLSNPPLAGISFGYEGDSE